MDTPLPAVKVVEKYQQAWDLLQQRLAPSRLKATNKTADALRDYTAKYEMNAATVEQMVNAYMEAVEALFFDRALDWETISPVFHQKMTLKRQQDFDAKERARIEKEKLENSKPFDTGTSKQVEAQKAKTEDEKRQKTAQAQIDFLINTFTVNAGPGRIDQSRTESCRAALRGIRVHYKGRYDAALTLKVVNAAIVFETPEAIIRAAERETNRLDLAANPTVKPRRDSLGTY